MSTFDNNYDRVVGILETGGPINRVSPEMRELLQTFHNALVAQPLNLQNIKKALLDLLQFLTTPQGRTEGNCWVVNMYIALADWDESGFPDLPDDMGSIIADMGMTLHETFPLPQMAWEYESTPEQLLERTRNLTIES